jgi:hypothetical protein
MRVFNIFFLTCLFSTTLYGQQSLVLEVHSGSWIPMPSDPVDFFHLAMFTEDESFDTRISFETSGVNSGEIRPLNPFQEGPTPGRKVYEVGFFGSDITGIRFFFSNQPAQPFMLRIYMSDVDAPEPINLSTGGLETACACPLPPYCDRNCWCPTGNCDPAAPAVSIQPSHIIIHHSAGSNVSANFAAVVAAIRDFHVNTNGWDDIGYNWLIDPNGIIYEGRGSGKRGAHFSCMNGGTTGICLMGNYMTIPPTPAALNALHAFLTWESCDKDIQPGNIGWHAASMQHMPFVAGHRDGNASSAPGSCARNTACPGDSLYPLLQQIALRAAADPCLLGGASESIAMSAAGVVEPTVAAGGQIHYYGQQTYLGTLSSPFSVTAGVFLSTDTIWDVSDLHLGVFNGTVDSLSRNHFFDTSWTVPIGTQYGQYYLLFVADLTSVAAPLDSTKRLFLPIEISGTIGLPGALSVDLQIFPNPTTGTVKFKSNHLLRGYAVFAITGHEVAHGHFHGGKEGTIDLRHLPNGKYFIEIAFQDGGRNFQKIILQR